MLTRYFRWIYFGWFATISALIVLQLYLAGYGVFGGGFGAHLVNGWLIGLAILAGIGLAFAARVPWRMTGINAILLVLMAVQSVLAHTEVPGISALHVVNGVLILVGTLYLTWEAWKVARTSPPETQTVPAPAAFKT